MAKSNSAQKFMARNRPPRVQIEYEVETYGALQKVELPFVMGVMADLSGKWDPEVPTEHQSARGELKDRKFLEIDIDNFDERMKAMRPRATFQVPNTLTGEGNLSVDLTFESMDDFTPAALAKKVEPLRNLLETRTQLKNLLSYIDGKSGAEKRLGELLNQPELLKALAAAPKPEAKE
jgi:type VI secretion system protein ImpB